MADTLCNKLLHSLSSNHHSRFPLTLSPHSNFSITRFASLRRTRRLSHSSVFAKFSSDSTRLDIISTAENSDGSVVFKFGDASEVRRIVENVDVSDAKLEVLEGSNGDNDVAKSEVVIVGVSSGEDSVNGAKLEVVETCNGDDVVKSDIVGTTSGEDSVNGMKTEVVGTSDDEYDVSEAKVESIGTSEGGVDAIDAKSEVAGTSDGECDVNDAKTDGLGTSEGEHDDSDAKLEVAETSSDEDSVSDTKSEVLGTIDGEDDVNDAEFEVLGTSEGEHDASDEKAEVAGTSGGELDDIEAKVEVVGVSESEGDTSDANLEVAGTLDGEHDDKEATFEVVGVSASEGDVSDAKSEVAGTLDGEHDVNEEKLEVVGTLESEQELVETLKDEGEVKVEGESGNDSELVKVGESGNIEVASSVESEPESEETTTESISQTIELVGSSGETEEASTDEVVAQSNGVTNEDEQDQTLILTAEPESTSDSEIVNRDSESDSLVTSDTNIDVIMESSNDSEVVSDDVEIDTVVTTSDSSADSTIENVEEISDVEAVVVLPTSQLECDQSESVEISETSSHVGASDTTIAIENSELESNVEHVVIEDSDINDCLETAEANSLNEALDVAISLEHNELESKLKSNVKDVVTEDDESKSLEFAETDSDVEASDMEVSLEHNELDSNVKLVVNEDDYSVELAQEPAQLAAEHTIAEEGTYDSVDDVVELESALDGSTVNDIAPSTAAQCDDDPCSGDVVEAAGPEASGITSPETNFDSDDSVELSTSTLSVSSAAASLLHPSEALTGGEDAYFVCKNWFGVADGVGQWSLRGTNKGQFAQELMQNCEKIALNSQSAGLTDVKEVLQQSAAMTQSTGSARVLIAHLANQVLHVANIGDTGFAIIRNGAVFKRSSPMVHEFHFPYAISSGDDPQEAAEEYQTELEDGDVIVTATDGLFDNLYEQEIASMVSKSVAAGMEPKDLAELLVSKAQEVGTSASSRSPFADAVQAAGHAGYNGGKLDHVTVIVSLVQKR